ncbi:unnamed protein product [Hermetia illucens]|uniref:STAS domain-containing protein n=1 Tax=Hermetia illucens TaxID=343691 RepID=A0A7R8UNQ7_HERIL|nr:sodium-independent sulfate anion transporter-like [Hermetia illucens]CAD7084101.1 unnamed protein product [Hermetia illucens]
MGKRKRVQNDSTDNLTKYYEEKLPDIGSVLKRKVRKTCTRKLLFNTFPVLNWLPKYKRSYAVNDVIAGLTVALTAIPQGIAYGNIAGLPPQYGLYSSFMACFVYIIFGTSKDVTIGPTAILSLMLQQYISSNPDYAILLCFLSGCIILGCGLLNLGFLVRFISSPVTVGFTCAAAVTIASGQINALLGIPSSSNEFLPSWENAINNISQTRKWDAILGITTMIGIIILRQAKNITGKGRLFFKYVSLSRNALAVFIGTLIAYLLGENGEQPFKLTGDIVPGLPSVQPPPFTTVQNGTVTYFSEMVDNLGISLLVVPLISILEIIAIGKSFSQGKIVDASQELIALGACNIVSSFVSSMPVTGAFTRSAVNNSSGVRTTLGGFYTGIAVLLAIQFLTETFYFIPKTVLAAVMIAAMIFMIEYDHVVLVWKSKKIDIIPLVVTFISCLFLGLEFGILCGIGVNVLFILYNSASPKINIVTEKIEDIEVILATVSENLVYSSAEYLRDKILRAVTESDTQIKYAIIDGARINSLDSTVAINLSALYHDLNIDKCELILWNWQRQTEGVIWRTNHAMEKCFRKCSNLNDVLYPVGLENNNHFEVPEIIESL